MRPVLGLTVLNLLLGCGGPGKVAGPPAPALSLPPPPGQGLRVSLVWSAPVDLDLYVTDPDLESVYFANPRSQTDGRLETDVRCGAVRANPDRGRWAETVVWTKVPAGHYRVGVDYIEACTASPLEEVDFRLVAEVAGKREERVGKVARERFQPVVLEFDVPGESRETRGQP